MQTMRVLIVEDEADNREIAEISLLSAGYRVTSCANGQEAVELCKRACSQFDIVLMDLAMPVMNGLEATRQLRREPTTKNALFLALSGRTAPHERQSGIEAGCDGFVAKPYRRRTLLNALAEALGRRALAATS
jgi:CheY-like chemotaxis protein